MFKILKLSPPLPQFCKVHVLASFCSFNPTSELLELSYTLILVSPLPETTSNISVGAVIPIPTAPADSIRSLSVSDVLIIKSPSDALPT